MILHDSLVNEKNDRGKVKDVRKEASVQTLRLHSRNKRYETEFKVIKNVFNAVLCLRVKRVKR